MTLFYETPLSKRYASQEMKELFSSAFKYQTWRKLWATLAEGEKKLGLPISSAQIDELKSKIKEINFDRVHEIEIECRHEVMAHLEAYREECPNAKGVIHLGATSSYVMDNGDLILLKSALQLLQQKLISLIEKLNHVALKEANTPCLGYTHFQIYQKTAYTVTIARLNQYYRAG